MIEVAEAIFGASGLEDRIAVIALLAARLGPIAVLAPFASVRGTPALVRLAIGLAIALAMAPVAASSAMVPHDALGFALAIGRELIVGGTFALAAGLPFHAIDFGGRLADTIRGASLAEVISPYAEERTSPLGDLHTLACVAAFFALGGHRLVVRAIADGLVDVPLGGPTEASVYASVAHGAVALISSAIGLAASLAAPAFGAVLLAEIAMGVLARTAPQVPVFFAAMPLRAAVGLAAAVLVLAVLVREPGLLATGVDEGARLLRTFAP